MATVLVVDDDPGIRLFMRRILEKEKIDVVEASNGKEGIEAFQAISPDVVVIDVIMPEVDGISAIEEIRKIDSQAKIASISGGDLFCPDIYLEEATATGADATISKPFSIQCLKDCINKLLNTGR